MMGRWRRGALMMIVAVMLGGVAAWGWPAWAADSVIPGQINLTLVSQTPDQALAAGESLMFSVKLLNFGSVSRADVLVTYEILAADQTVKHRETETVAVDTTAAFVKQIVLPSSLAPGMYTLKTRITYSGQTALAESQFSFEVVELIWGLRKTVFMALAVATVVVLVVFGTVIAWAVRTGARARAAETFDYSHRKDDEQVYYQLISESIAQMRRLNGDAALKAAGSIPGLRIDPRTGEVLEITGNPMVIMNVLVLRYETLLGRRMNEVLKHDNAINKEGS